MKNSSCNLLGMCSNVDRKGSSEEYELQVPAATEAGCLFGSGAATALGARDIFKTRSAVTLEEVQGLMDKMKAELLQDIRAELKILAVSVHNSTNAATSSLEELQQEAQELRRDLDSIQARVDRGPLSRALANCAFTICGSSEEKQGRAKSSARRVPPPPRTSDRSAEKTQSINNRPIDKRKAEEQDVSSPGVHKVGTSRASLLTPALRRFEAATGSDIGQSPSADAEVNEIDREAFVSGLEDFAELLDNIGGSMGSYLTTNIQKLRNSKARNDKTGYREWLLSELPTHKATGYREYVDDSAWMANLWIGWSLEFFVEMFAQLHKGRGTAQSVEEAYYKTLYEHHNFFQRTSFLAAMKRLPGRGQLMTILSGKGSDSDVQRDLGDFVEQGRSLVKFCLFVNEELDGQLKFARQQGSS